MPLKGIKPEVVVPQKPKILISGPAGSQKTTFCLHAPTPYLIDTEAGAKREQYMEALAKAGGLYFGPEQGSQDFTEIIEQVRTLATEKTPFKTIIIDSLTKPYNLAMYAAEDRGVSPEFKKSRREAERPARKLLSWLMRPDLDLTVLMVAHGKDKWSRDGKELVKEGTTWDGPEKLDFDLDLWLETRISGQDIYATVKKSRVKGFIVGANMPFDFETFKKMYGAAVVDRAIKPIVLATKEQVVEIERIVGLLKMSEEEVDKILLKAQVTEIVDLSAENATKFLEFLTKKLKGDAK